MKSIAKAFVIGSLVLATQAAWSSPLGWGNTDLAIVPAQSTYADEHGGSQATVSGNFPLGAEALSFKTEPPVQTTYKAEHAGNQTAVSGDFPLGAEALSFKTEPPVRSTYADSHLKDPLRFSESAQTAGTSVR